MFAPQGIEIEKIILLVLIFKILIMRVPRAKLGINTKQYFE